MNVYGIDRLDYAVNIDSVGREDRALLRSNPSARTGAGTGVGAWPRLGSHSPSLFWPSSEKPWGSGGKAPSSGPTATCQLSRFSGLG